ncbi:GNAT family acetyltransferase [Glutamicibacter protophormiae]|uniref:GNAT family acetyltransferase n=1 Tax=Glutamicibacter protophormiae TaxID=37930 RepID=UPI002A817EBD|nr:GNAT family acetyltransferase [Glutamicibacter protophormiae]WPR65655.1 GNAT family acetyltransferase [Glutamicibacter protophormiae]WPR69152.1 GNAT family acetyltransferase [Glutamicibacter protophormiae]
MEIIELSETWVDQAVELWERTGLTRPWNDPQADARKALAGTDSTILGLVHGQRLIATAMAGDDGHRGWLYYVAVDPGSQGQGCGQRIVEAAAQWLRTRGTVKVQLMVRTGNDAVTQFYEKLGYERQKVSVLGKRLVP